MSRMIPWLAYMYLLTSTLIGHAGEKSMYPRPLETVKKTLNEILANDKAADENARALQRLKAYRYLTQLPYEDLTLDDEFNKMCLAGAKLCEKLGKLEHTPKNPGWPEDEYKIAYQGTSRSNLGQGYKSLVLAVDAWMEDSDANNIAHLGHRRWCLNPSMGKTGFGRAGIFTAMYSFDMSRKDVPDYDFIAYPPRGYVPVELFGARHAWSVTLNPKRYKAPAKDYSPNVYRADEAGNKVGEPLKLDFKNVDTLNFAVPICIIFRPEKISLAPASRYLVELERIVRVSDGETETLRYVVEFAKSK